MKANSEKRKSVREQIKFFETLATKITVTPRNSIIQHEASFVSYIKPTQSETNKSDSSKQIEKSSEKTLENTISEKNQRQSDCNCAVVVENRMYFECKPQSGSENNVVECVNSVRLRHQAENVEVQTKNAVVLRTPKVVRTKKPQIKKSNRHRHAHNFQNHEARIFECEECEDDSDDTEEEPPPVHPRLRPPPRPLIKPKLLTNSNQTQTFTLPNVPRTLNKSNEINYPEEEMHTYKNLDEMMNNGIVNLDSEIGKRPELPVKTRKRLSSASEFSPNSLCRRTDIISLISNSSNSSKEEDSSYEDNLHTYMNLLDVMKSGIMSRALVKKYQDPKSYDSVMERNRTDTIESDPSEYSLEEHEGEYFTFTKYERVPDAGYMHIKDFWGLPPKANSDEALHYKTITVFDNDQKLRKTEVSKVKLSKNRIEKEEVQKFNDKKEYVIDELITTEEYYVNTLEKALRLYGDVLREKIGVANVDIIFKNLRQICDETKVMLEEFKENRKDYEVIGKKFIQNKNLFERYTVYVHNKKDSDKKCAEFENIITQLEDDLKESLGLSSHLLLPIQRLAKYELLLKSLEKCLVGNNLPVQNVHAAVTLIQHISSKCNDMIELDLIHGRPSNLNFDNTGRLMMRHNMKMMQPKKMDIHVFLSKRKVFFCRKDNAKAENFNFWGEIELEELGLIQDKDHPTIFSLRKYYGKKMQKNYVLYKLDARTPEVKQEWVSAIEHMLWEQLRECKKNTLLRYYD